MSILYRKPIKAQAGALTYTPQKSLDYNYTKGIDPYLGIASTVSGADRTAQYLYNTDPKIPKGGITQNLNANKGSNYRMALQGSGDVQIGNPGNDTIINLDDQKIHQFDMRANTTGNVPFKVLGDPKKKSNANILQFTLTNKVK